MPYREPIAAGCYYHVYNRGVGRQAIFYDDENMRFFLRRLRHFCQPGRAQVVAYCLMPNHYHLLVQVQGEQFSQQVMQPLGVSFAKAINQEHQRVGPLFQGPFRALLVERDDYLLSLSRYVHRNPVAAGLVAYPEDWLYSSYRDYIGLRADSMVVPQVVLQQFDSRQAYREFVESRDEKDRQGIEGLLME